MAWLWKTVAADLRVLLGHAVQRVRHRGWAGGDEGGHRSPRLVPVTDRAAAGDAAETGLVLGPDAVEANGYITASIGCLRDDTGVLRGALPIHVG